MTKLHNLAVGLLVAGGLVTGVQAAVLATPLTTDVTANISAAQSACAQLQYDHVLLDISRAIGDATGVATNLNLVKADQTAARSADQTLRTSIAAYMKPALDAVSAADTLVQSGFVQLKTDAHSNTGALSGDQSAVLSSFATLTAAQGQAQANQQALAGAGAMDSCDAGPDGFAGSSAGGQQH
jgi:hypothetical protein